MELDYKIQTYAWGKKGADSLVATLHANVNKKFKIENNESYAELWLGTHVNGPSVIKGSDELLSDFLNKHPECIGSTHVRKMFGTELPFLFKVLSIDKALSVQVHPSKVSFLQRVTLFNLSMFRNTQKNCTKNNLIFIRTLIISLNWRLR